MTRGFLVDGESAAARAALRRVGSVPTKKTDARPARPVSELVWLLLEYLQLLIGPGQRLRSPGATFVETQAVAAPLRPTRAARRET